MQVNLIRCEQSTGAQCEWTGLDDMQLVALSCRMTATISTVDNKDVLVCARQTRVSTKIN